MFRNFILRSASGSTVARLFFALVSSMTLYISIWHNLDVFRDQLALVRSRNRGNDTFDFIIVGAGSSGSVLAHRLSEHFHVLLLDAGGEPFSPLSNVPALAMLSLNHKEIDWNHRTVPQQKACGASYDRVSGWSAGKGLGGSSNIDFMIHSRGHPKDYDNWASIIDPGRPANSSKWGYNGVLPFFKKLEDYDGDWESDEYHGVGGPVRIALSEKLSGDLFVKAAQESGYSKVDLNGRFTEGFDNIHYPIKNGRRQSTFNAYIKPIRQRRSLTIHKFARVNQILFQGKNNDAYGVQYHRHGRIRQAFATREIILSAGAIKSPHILQLSGIGKKEDLESLDIEVKHDSPMVGSNLQDHVGILVGPFFVNEGKSLSIDRDIRSRDLMSWYQGGVGPFSSSTFNSIGYIASTTAKDEGQGDWPDIQYLYSGVSYFKEYPKQFSRAFNIRQDILTQYTYNALDKDSFSIMTILSRPVQRGEIKLKYNDPSASPLIDPHYLESERDVKVLIEGVKKGIDIIEKSKTFQSIGAKFTTRCFPGCEQFEFRSDEYYECWIRQATLSFHDVVGTAAMGPGGKSSVVDSEFRVIGTRNLRVIDCSVIPTLPIGNTNAAAIMLGEKGANLILEQWATSQSATEAGPPSFPSMVEEMNEFEQSISSIVKGNFNGKPSLNLPSLQFKDLDSTTVNSDLTSTQTTQKPTTSTKTTTTTQKPTTSTKTTTTTQKPTTSTKTTTTTTTTTTSTSKITTSSTLGASGSEKKGRANDLQNSDSMTESSATIKLSSTTPSPSQLEIIETPSVQSEIVTLSPPALISSSSVSPESEIVSSSTPVTGGSEKRGREQEPSNWYQDSRESSAEKETVNETTENKGIINETVDTKEIINETENVEIKSEKIDKVATTVQSVQNNEEIGDSDEFVVGNLSPQDTIDNSAERNVELINKSDGENNSGENVTVKNTDELNTDSVPPESSKNFPASFGGTSFDDIDWEFPPESSSSLTPPGTTESVLKAQRSTKEPENQVELPIARKISKSIQVNEIQIDTNSFTTTESTRELSTENFQNVIFSTERNGESGSENLDNEEITTKVPSTIIFDSGSTKKLNIPSSSLVRDDYDSGVNDTTVDDLTVNNFAVNHSDSNDTTENNSEVGDSAANDLTVKASAVKNSVNDATVKNSVVNDPEVNDTTENNSMISDSIVKDSTVNKSAVNDSEVDDTTEKNSEVNDTTVSTVHDVTVKDPAVNSTTEKAPSVNNLVNDLTVNNSAVNDTTLEDSTVNNSAVNDTTLEDSTVNNSAVNDSGVNDTTENNSMVSDSIVNNSAVNDSEVNDTTEKNSAVNDVTVSISAVHDIIVKDPAVNSTTTEKASSINNLVNDLTVNNSAVSDPTVEDSTVSNSAVNDSEINDTTLKPSSVSSSAVSDKTENDTTVNDLALNDTTENNNSEVNAPTVNDSTVTDSAVNSTTIVKAPTVNNSVVIDSEVNDTTENDSAVIDSTVNDLSSNDTTMNNSVVNNRTVKALTVNSSVIDSTVNDSAVHDSDINDTTENNSAANDTTENAAINDSTVNDTTHKDSTVNSVSYSTVKNTTVQNSAVNDTTENKSLINNITENDSAVNNTTVHDSTVNISAVNDITVKDSTVSSAFDDAEVNDTTENSSAVNDKTVNDSGISDTTINDSIVNDSSLNDTTLNNLEIEQTTISVEDEIKVISINGNVPIENLVFSSSSSSSLGHSKVSVKSSPNSTLKKIKNSVITTARPKTTEADDKRNPENKIPILKYSTSPPSSPSPSPSQETQTESMKESTSTDVSVATIEATIEEMSIKNNITNSSSSENNFFNSSSHEKDNDKGIEFIVSSTTESSSSISSDINSNYSSPSEGKGTNFNDIQWTDESPSANVSNESEILPVQSPPLTSTQAVDVNPMALDPKSQQESNNKGQGQTATPVTFLILSMALGNILFKFLPY